MHSTESRAKVARPSVEATPPTVEDFSKRCPRSARQIAVRVLILQGVVAVASEVDPEPIREWFQEQRIRAVSLPKRKRS